MLIPPPRTDGNVLGIDVLLKVAVEAGLNAEDVRGYIKSKEANEKTHYEADLHSRRGVQSVPF